MVSERFNSFASRHPAAMDSEPAIAVVESEGKIMGPPIKSRAVSDILQPLIELVDGVVVDIEQQKAEVDQVGIGVMLDFFDHLSNKRAVELGQDALRCAAPGNPSRRTTMAVSRSSEKSSATIAMLVSSSNQMFWLR